MGAATVDHWERQLSKLETFNHISDLVKFNFAEGQLPDVRRCFQTPIDLAIPGTLSAGPTLRQIYKEYLVRMSHDESVRLPRDMRARDAAAFRAWFQWRSYSEALHTVAPRLLCHALLGLRYLCYPGTRGVRPCFCRLPMLTFSNPFDTSEFSYVMSSIPVREKEPKIRPGDGIDVDPEELTDEAYQARDAWSNWYAYTKTLIQTKPVLLKFYLCDLGILCYRDSTEFEGWFFENAFSTLPSPARLSQI